MEELPEEYDRIVVGPHLGLVKRKKIEELEEELLQKIRASGEASLSKLWLTSNCHLWEIAYALRRLKEKGLIEERTA